MVRSMSETGPSRWLVHGMSPSKRVGVASYWSFTDPGLTRSECEFHMINKLIEFSLKNRFLILLGSALLAAWGYWALIRTPIDAIPDLSENQVIVFTDWAGRSPQ